jgi:hypothetical protein
MNAESITSAIRQIFRLLMPPILNLVILGYVIDKSLGSKFANATKELSDIIPDRFLQMYHFAQDSISIVTQNVTKDEIEGLTHAPIFAAFFNAGTGFTTALLVYTSVVLIVFSVIVDYFTLLLASAVAFCGSTLNVRGFLITAFGKLSSLLGSRLIKYADAVCDFAEGPPHDQELVAYAQGVLLAPYQRRKLSNTELDKVVYAWLCQNDRVGYTIEKTRAMLEKQRWAQNVEAHFQLYSILCVVVNIYAFCWNRSIVQFISVLIFPGLLLILIWISAHISVLRIGRQIQIQNLNSFLFCRIALMDMRRNQTTSSSITASISPTEVT